MADLHPPLQGYSLWLEGTDDDQHFFQDIVNELAHRHNTRPFTAHATLIGLLDKNHDDLEEIKKVCEKLAGSYTHFITEIIGVGMRDTYFQSVFLPVAPSQNLVAMNQQARDLFGHENDPPFMPHWSAVYGNLDPVTKSEISHRLIIRCAFPRIVAIKYISLVDVQGYPDEWQILERYPPP